jgi:predicted Zn-dependent protease
MRKTVTTISLLIVIFLTFGFIVLFAGFNIIEPGNTIDTTFRKPVLSIAPLRKIMHLEQIGDARYEYIAKRFYPMVVHIYYQEGTSLESKTVNKFAQEIYHLTHKAQKVQVENPVILSGFPDKVNDDDIAKILQTYSKDTSIFSTSIPLYIFVLKYYTVMPSYAGLVKDAHSIFLFKNAINFMSQDSTFAEKLETSTLLHEFGHLAGADHIDNTDCIMAGTVENRTDSNALNNYRETYCDEDIVTINTALKY